MPSYADIDRLGEKYCRDPADIETLSALFQFCQEVKQRTNTVLAAVQEVTTRKISPRNGKSFRSIREKLDRRSVKLSGMQDIEGCRIIVDSVVEQDILLLTLLSKFVNVKVDDRRRKPVNGYRAVHLVVRSNEARYEIQIRTVLQHNWAEVSERLAARYGSELKYQGSPVTQKGRLAAQRLIDDAGGVELCEDIEELVWKLWVGHIDESADDMAERVSDLIGDDVFGPNDAGRLGSFESSKAMEWAERAQKRLVSLKSVWRKSLLEAINLDELE